MSCKMCGHILQQYEGFVPQHCTLVHKSGNSLDRELYNQIEFFKVFVPPFSSDGSQIYN